MKLLTGDIGIISEVDATNMLVRVKMMPSGIVSPPLMFITPGFYYMPQANDQVVCFYDERRNQGVAFGRAWQEGTPQYDDEKIIGIKLEGAEIFIDRKTGEISVSSDKTVTVKATSITLEADTVEITKDLKVAGKSELTGAVSAKGTIEAVGNISTNADVKAQTKSLLTHIHTSAAPGSPTSPPVL